MEPKSEKRSRLFVNPFTIWTEMWASAHAAAVRATAPKVAVIPTAGAPPPKAQTPAVRPVRQAARPLQQASKATRFRAARPKVRSSKAKAKRRAKR